ncbi:vacuolar protein sorting-associated protein 37B-like [Dreissena polymorpha]|uniref:VPS37 C-terminal domain-containing protein n=1 Tax=Dreissena polymorpha TaxID=45954 RepID=A0A9D4MZ95_DREPO|nr:vacuolar protein sorting-associated protein 37B-like [Dreissena polymorpha]KAH3885261.1 hypothetical protein DPMN_009254 [Dreissena polymorpha]
MYQGYLRSSDIDAAPQYVPDEHEALSLFQYMDCLQLQEYLDNQNKLDEHIRDLNQVKKIEKDKKIIIEKNRALAEFNMTLQRPFADLKTAVGQAYEEMNQLKESIRSDLATLESQSLSQSQDTMMAICQTEVAQADEESENIADAFSRGELLIETFISEYVDKRTHANIKRAKLEKLTDLIRQNGGPSPSSVAPYPVNNYISKSTDSGFSQAPYGQTPYPTSYSGMPVPQIYR